MSDASEVSIEFKSRHGQISERMQSHAVEKLARLARYTDWLTRVEVVAENAHESPEIEMIAHLRKGGPLICKDRSTTFSATIDLLVDKMDTLLRKQKERITDHKVAGGKAPAGPAGAGDDSGEESYEDIVRKTMRD